MAPQTSEGNGMTYERALETAINMRLRTDYAGNRVSAIKRMATVRRRKEARRLELKNDSIC